MSASSSGPQANQLCLAAGKGECETIRELVNNGAKFEPDENGRTALHYAANYGQTVALKLCLQLGCELDFQDKNGCTSLHRAVLDGQVDVVKVLLYEGCAVDRQDENGNTALHEAAWGGYSKILDLLIKRGKAHVHASNKHGHKPIHLACQNGHNESTRILLRAGNNPNTKNNNGDTPLHVASLFGHVTCSRILISSDCNINVKNKDGNTPLHIAAGLGKQKITKVLLEAKCDTNIRNNNNATAVELARQNNHAETVLMILSAHREGGFLCFLQPVNFSLNTPDHCRNGVHLPNKSSLWRGSTSRRKPRKNRSSKDDSKKQQKQNDEDEDDHAGLPTRVKGRREIKEEDKHKRQDARKRTEERLLMNENYEKWRELQGNLLRQELRKQAEIHGHKHGKSLTTSHSDCKACIQKLENQVEASKEKMMFELETAKARFEHKLRKMDRKMTHQAACMDRLCQERIKAEATECLHRIDKRAIEERAAWAEENDARLEIVTGDLRKWVEGRLQDVQKQLKILNGGEGSAGKGLRVRSRSESDLGNLDSMDETEITDTDGEDIQGIVIGRGREANGQELPVDEVDGDEANNNDNHEDQSEGMDKEEDNEPRQASTLQRRRPMMRGRNVRTGKYGKPQVTIGRSQSLDREVAIARSIVEVRNHSEDSSSDEHSQGEEDVEISHTKHVNFTVPTYGSVTNDSKVKVQPESDSASDRGRPAQRTVPSKRTSSFTRAVQHEMWAAARANIANDSDGSGRASDGSGRVMVEGTYRPPIVVVNEPHRMGSYGTGDGIQPANLSSADSDSETDTLSLTSSVDSLVTVSYLTADSSSGTLTSHQGASHASGRAPVLLSNSRQPASGQSESSPNTSQTSSSPGDAAASKRNSDCSKSSSGISSAASTTFSQHRDPMDDIVVRASSMESRAPNRWPTSRDRPSSTVDIPPPRDFASNQFTYPPGQYSVAPQQYVTSRSAYSAQQKANQSTTNQPGASPSGYIQPRQTAVVQPPAFRSSKSSNPLAGGSAFAVRSSPSNTLKRNVNAPSNAYSQIPQEQRPVLHVDSTHQRHEHDQVPRQMEQKPVRYQPVPAQQRLPRGMESSTRGQVQHGAAQAAVWQQHRQTSYVTDRQMVNSPVPASGKTTNLQDTSRRVAAYSASRSGQLLQHHQGSYNSSAQPTQTQSTSVPPRGSLANPGLANNGNQPRNLRPHTPHLVPPYAQAAPGQSTSVPSHVSLPNSGVENNGNSSRNPRPMLRPQSPRLVPPHAQAAPSQSASVPPQVSIPQHGVDNNGNPARNPRCVIQERRPQTPHLVPPYTTVPPPVTHRPQGVNPQSGEVKHSTGGQKPAIMQPATRDTRPVNQRPLVRRTYEISL